MDDISENVEINNPMFGGDDFDDAGPDDLSNGQPFGIVDGEDKVRSLLHANGSDTKMN